MAEAETYQEEIRQLVELAGTGMYGSASLKSRITKLLSEYKGKVKTPYQVREELAKIKGSMAEEVVRMRAAE